jgi:5-methylcytosine-specific restriction endonuclease McrBC regulatory subunit McrC
LGPISCRTFRGESDGSDVEPSPLSLGALWDPRDLEHLPAMRTDVSLEAAHRKIIIDAKYYRDPMQTNFGTDVVHR